MAIMNNISVWWHVVGAAVVVLIVVLVPDEHQSASFVFTERFNNSGFGDGTTGGITFWLAVLPLGFLLTQYTITGLRRVRAPVRGDRRGVDWQRPEGIWQSIFYSAIGGWILLLAFLFAANDVDAVNEQAGFVGAIFETALTNKWAGAVFIISTIGQFFCTMSCMTSCSRMTFAFSRDGAIPGSSIWRKVDVKRVPRNAVLFGAVVAVLLTLPALYKSPVGCTHRVLRGRVHRRHRPLRRLRDPDLAAAADG